MYSVYALVDPRDNSPHYVGMSADVYKRFAQHILFPRNEAKSEWIEGLKQVNLMPSLTVLEDSIATSEEARAREQYWIASYSNDSMPPTNMRIRDDHNTTGINSTPEEELRETLKTLGWSLELRARRKTGKRYAYSRRKKSGKVISKYLCPEDKMSQLDKETIENKLR